MLKKITANKTKHSVVENEFKKLKTFDSSFFRGKNDFEDDGTQNVFVFQPIHKFLKLLVLMIQIFYHGNLKDCLTIVLRHLLHQIKSLIFH